MAAVAGKKYRVNAMARDGFVDRRRGGEAWPRGAGNFREVLVVDQDEDPAGRVVDGQFAIGQKTFALLKQDPEIFVDSSNGTAADDAEKADLRDKCAKLEARVVELETLLEQATASGRKGK